MIPAVSKAVLQFSNVSVKMSPKSSLFAQGRAAN